MLCQEGADPSATLAVTFTNKATTEMKQRIVSEMWNLAQGSPSPFRDVVKAMLRRDGVIDDDGPAAEQLITRRAAQALHNILHRYDDFHVLTIDTFFHGLLTALAHELGLFAGCGVEIDDEQVSAQAVREILQQNGIEAAVSLRDGTLYVTPARPADAPRVRGLLQENCGSLPYTVQGGGDAP